MIQSELMLGDLVWMKSLSKYCKVFEFYHGFEVLISLQSIFVHSIDHTSMSDIEPIPLTKEILELNGWEQGKYPMQEAFEHKDVYNCGTLYVKIVEKGEDRGFGAWNINDDAYLVFSCKYVHELQQALRINGYMNMAQEFKIIDIKKVIPVQIK